MRRPWGTFYLLPRGIPADAENVDTHVVRTYRHGPSNIRIAEELLRLSGDAERAERLAAVFRRACERSAPLVDSQDIVDLLEILEGLEQRVDRALLDERGHIRADKMDDLRRRSQYLAVDDDGPQARLAVLNAFANVGDLLVALADARANDLEIALD